MSQIAIIPVAGAGTRLRPFTYTQPKALIPVAGKPIISYIVDDLRAQNVEKFIFIVGYFGEKIVDYITQSYPNLQAEFVFQMNRDGLGHAIHLTREFISDEDEVIIALGDSLVELNDQFFKSNSSTIAIKKVKDPSVFGVVELDENDKIQKFVEKPKFPKSNLALVGWYRLREIKLLFDILEKFVRDDIRTDGEIQLTDVLNEMLNQGSEFELISADQWLDVGNGEVLLNSNALILKKYGGLISSTAMINNSVIIEPVFFGENVTIQNSVIGPNVSVGDFSEIHSSILENGMIGSYTKLNHQKLTTFVIGSDTILNGKMQSISLGDNTEIDF